MSGTPQKMLEHLLETQVMLGPNDPFLDDFLLTHIVFLPVPRLIDELANQYPFQSTLQNLAHYQEKISRISLTANLFSPIHFP